MLGLSPEWLVVLMFIGLFIGLFTGHPLAFVLGGLGVIFGLIGSWGPNIFSLFPNRIYGNMDNYVLLAIPLFIFMAQFLDQSGVTEALFDALRFLLGPMRGGIGIAVIIVCTIFAACTGVIGASVVAMGLLALPMMMRYGYDKQMTCGAICAGGTLGILIPPSIMLVVMASEASMSVGQLFAGAVIPGLILATLYTAYIAIRCFKNPKMGPPISPEELAKVTKKQIAMMVLKSLVPPVILILGVLGTLFAGIATPTEASGGGAFLAFLMVVAYGKFSWHNLQQAVVKTGRTSTMVLIVLVGATCFTGVFLGNGGGDVVTQFVLGMGFGKWGTFAIMMAIVFLLGMFIDWLGIVLICFPLFLPIAAQLGFDKLWFVVIMAVNLQTSFLTPPFGYALFYLRGIAVEGVETIDIYKGIVPYVILMLIGLVFCTMVPATVTWLPTLVVK
jgi:tripartite ATP-independent transporter DctM subunit